MARRTIFNATFCCGNMLQQFEIDPNCGNIVARTLSKLVRVTPSSSTFNATLYQPFSRTYCCSHNRVLPLYMDANTPNQVIKLLFVQRKYRAKAGASSTANSLISWWYVPLSSLLLIQLLVQITLSRLLKTSSSSKLSVKRRICRNFTFLRWFDSSSATLLAEMLTLLLIALAMLR